MKVLFTSIVVMTALAGCSATMPNIAGKTKTDTSVQKIEKTDPDTQAALADMKLVGFRQEDFGSEEAFNSAAKMVANLGAEWQTFNSWTEDLLDPNNQRKALERIRTANDERRQKERNWIPQADRDKAMKYGFHDCFNDSGELRSVDDFINHYTRVDVGDTFKGTLDVYERCLINGGNECTENGQELSLDKFLVNYNKAAPQERKDLAFKEYYERCAAPTAVSSVQYTISAHDNDVMGSLIAAAASRVGWDSALKMSRDVLNMQSRSGAMNMIAANYYNYQRTGYFDAFDIRPFAIGRSSVISVLHVGGMCAAFGTGNGNDNNIEIDELAIALGAKPRQTNGGYHCLKWTDGNWKRVADYVAGESEGLRGFMSVYSPAFNNYQVPYWSYPSPYHADAVAQVRTEERGSGLGYYKEHIHERETCFTYAAGHSGLATWSYPACDYLEKASESMKAKEKMMQAAGRFDAYICSRAEAVNGYGKPDLSRCPTVFSREQIEAGEHKR